jgi:hypothetical protein
MHMTLWSPEGDYEGSFQAVPPSANTQAKSAITMPHSRQSGFDGFARLQTLEALFLYPLNPTSLSRENRKEVTRQTIK